MYVEWILEVLHGFTDVLGIHYNVGFIYGFSDGEVLGYNIGVPYIFIVGIDEGCRLGFLVSSYYGLMKISPRFHFLVNDWDKMM